MTSVETTLITAKYILHNFAKSRQIPPEIIKDGALIIEGNKVQSILPQAEIAHGSFDTVVEYPHHVLLPGLVNTHSHAGMTLFRGMADDLDLMTWLTDHIWPAEALLTAEHVKYGAELSAIEALMSGTTTFNSMYWHVEQEISAFSEVGVRLLCGPSVLVGIEELNLNRARKLISSYHGAYNDMIHIALNPHAPYTVTDEEYHKIHEFVSNYNSTKEDDEPKVMIHTHLDEAPGEIHQIRRFADERGFSIKEGIETPTEYFADLGILSSDLFLAHGVNMSPSDIELLADHEVGVSHNPSSNMKLGNTFAPVVNYYDQGVNIGLGTDSATSNNNLDMYEEIKMTALIHKGFHNLPTRPKAHEVLHMATDLGASAMGWQNIGDLGENSYADFQVIDLDRPHLKPLFSTNSLISHLVYSVKGADVVDVMVNGEFRMQDRKPLGIELDDFLSKYEQIALDLYSKLTNT